jgi:hypothetical protein
MFTEGPFVQNVEELGSTTNPNISIHQSTTDGESICEMYSVSVGNGDIRDNAKLICAAHQMFEALRYAIMTTELTCGLTRTAVERMKNAFDAAKPSDWNK